MESRPTTRTIVAALALSGILLMPILSGCKSGTAQAKKTGIVMENGYFYKGDKFDSTKAKRAYYALMERFNVPLYSELKRPDGPFWAIDFGKGDFLSFGMGGVFWCNEKREGYFAQEIYLLPGQNTPEQRYLTTTDIDGKPIRAKIVSWQVRHGYVYGFSEIGEPNIDLFPEAKTMLSKLQIPHLKSVHVQRWEADGKVHKLAGPETWHFLQAGKQGAIVTEYATYHDNAGVHFSVPNTVP